MRTPAANSKPYLKLASTLVLVGSGLFTLERLGLSRFEQPGHPLNIDGTVLSIMVLVPILLVVAGAIVFVVGRMRRL